MHRVARFETLILPLSLHRLAIVMAMASLLFAGCGVFVQHPSEPADAFLKQTVDLYHSLATFRAASVWRAATGSTDFNAARSFEYLSPNKYRIESIHDNTLLLRSVSDGAQVTEYSNVPGMMAQIYPAPASLDTADSPQLKNPVDCGSPLFAFFGSYSQMVEGPVSYGRSMVVDYVRSISSVQTSDPTMAEKSAVVEQVPCTAVLYRSPMYGQVTAVIGNSDHLVREISYDAADLVAKGATVEDESAPSSGAPPFTKSLHASPKKLLVTETFSAIDTAVQTADADFDTELPQDIPPFQIAEGPTGSGGGSNQGAQDMADFNKPPVPIGSPAPDASVTDARTGAEVRLSSLRGKVVVLDFFASWCMPCRMSLPETQRIYTDYGSQGVDVMGIDSESRGSILSFVKQNNYEFPVYEDKGLAASSAYNANAIPCIAVIDKAGRLSAYYVGLQDKGVVAAAVQKADS